MPPMTVASYRHMGENPEENAEKTVDDFVRKSGFLQIKPDIRHFGFEHPPKHVGDHPGYEVMVSIPDTMDIPAPLAKKKIPGGLYAAYTIDIYEFESILGMYDWLKGSDQYQFDTDLTRIGPITEEIIYYGGRNFLCEQLNYFYNIQNPVNNPVDIQKDMLMPIKPVENNPDIIVDIKDSLEKCGFKARYVNKNKFKIIGFTKFMFDSDSGEDPVEDFTNEIKSDGRLDILNQFKKTGASILSFASLDLDSQRNSGGSWRWTYGLLESDITDKEAFMKHNPFVQKIDASKWLCLEYTSELDSHSIKMKAYEAIPKLKCIFNGINMGHIDEYPDGNIGKPVNEADKKSIRYHWLPVL